MLGLLCGFNLQYFDLRLTLYVAGSLILINLNLPVKSVTQGALEVLPFLTLHAHIDVPSNQSWPRDILGKCT